MHLVVMFILICIIAIAFAIVFKYRIEQTLSIACFALTAILYAFGLFGILAYGVYACFAACLGALAFIVRGVVKGSVEKKFITRSVLTPGFAVFCVFYVIMCFLHRNRTLNGWDEFSHWGLVVKNMHLLDALGNHPHATTLLTGYPPGVSLFHYLWMKICGYSESNFYISMNVLAFSLLRPAAS